MSTQLPPLFNGLIDDAAVFPPGNAPLPAAIDAHRRHRVAWYAGMVGPLLLRASTLPAAADLVAGPAAAPVVGVIGDTGIDGLFAAIASTPLPVRQVEVPVAQRGDDPVPGLRALLTHLTAFPTTQAYAEIPLAWGLMAALDVVAEARASGVAIAPKFRTGGLAAELFPSPAELAAVICACRERALPFKLTAGLHHAIRHTDPETGFTHHGFLNVLAAAARAASGSRGDVAEVTGVLAGSDPVLLIEETRRLLDRERPLWIGFGTCSVEEPIGDLRQLGLLDGVRM